MPWQHCQFHFSRNVGDKAPKNDQAGIHADLNEMFNCKTLEDAMKVRDRMLDEYGSVAPAAMECLENGFDDAMTVMVLPRWLRKYYRTSNHIERLNEELKRCSDVIGIFPNESSILRLMVSVLIEKHDALLKSEAPEHLMAVANQQIKRMME